MMRFAAKDQLEVNQSTIQEIWKGTPLYPGISTLFKMNPRTGRMDCLNKRIYRRNYSNLVEKIIEAGLVLLNSPFVSD